MKSRRKFLQHISAGVIPIAFGFTPESLLFNPDNSQNDKTLRVALMGLGSYANRVADAMKDSKRAKVVGVISGTPSKIPEWQKRFDIPDKNCYNYENFDAIKDNKDIDAVYIITPNAQHHNQCLRVAAAGKHVICEKPMAINAKEGREMVEACEKAGVKLLIGYRMHFEANTLEIVKMRNAGEFGDIKFFQGLSGFKIGDPNQWRLDPKLAGGGALMDIGIYAVNGTRYMVGEEPIWVTAQETKTDASKFREGVDETITFQLGFESGVVASCLSTYNMNNLDKFFLNGSKGFAEMQPSTGYGPIRSATHKGRLDMPHTTHQTTQMDEMAKIIFDNKVPIIPVDGKEGLKDIIILDAIYEAVRTGSKVDLNLT
ncbi:Gfo/Idh/MocA family oxidoreductase [Belliella sp. DSM 107340]|uniref:Gfo/Idh/MocA family oxidoreductase n=1 Tax=Belliella calami TaxID=2923436 RepID=A0ABS9URH2_9BACT|nr:Gfo/Idh/MocA family oxidoreductase [Belliella calami]MCH7399228.1 Gfo/Idh/MocA family oxidoreductase [Belliella calami]